MGRLFLLLFLIHLALAFAAIVDCLGGERKPERWSRSVWSLVIVFGLLAGPIAWFTTGRPGRKFAAPWNMPPPGRESRPLAPDDDPDFLAGLGPAPGTGPPGRPEPRIEPPPQAPGTGGASRTNDTAPDERNNGTG